MNSTTVATVVAAGLALATFAAGGIALWLHRRSTLQAPPSPQPRPTNPEPRRAAPSVRDETPFWFRDPVAQDKAAKPSATSTQPPPAAESPPTEPRAAAPPKPSKSRPLDPSRRANYQAELDAIDESARATKPRTTTAKPRTSPPTSAVLPINRKRRYSVRSGQPIELEIGDAPADAIWRSSRKGVELHVIEQRGDRLRFALDGEEGDVNVVLMQDVVGAKRPKVIRSWKFELRDAA